MISSATGILRSVSLLFIALAAVVQCAGAITLTPGSSGIATIAQGDPVTISGIATGQPQVGLQIWFIGYNFAKVTTVQVNSDDSYQYNLQRADTQNLAPGEYFVLVQHPMENGRFDIVLDSSGIVRNVNNGKAIYQFSGSGSLQSTNSVTALMNAIGSQNIDDTFAVTSFYVSTPAVSVAPPADIQQGQNLTISGTTTLAPGDQLLVQITSASFGPSNKTQSAGFSGASGTVTVMPGSGGTNTWSLTVDTSTFAPDEYIITVSGITQQVTGTARFTVSNCNASGETCSIPGLTPSITSPVVPATETANVTTAVVTVQVSPVPPTTSQKSGMPAALGILGIAAGFSIFRRIF